jgi:hypothetical protein
MRIGMGWDGDSASVEDMPIASTRPRGRMAGVKRRRVAWLALAVWTIGFEIGPTVHVALHEYLAPHEHEDHDAPPPYRAADHPAHGHHSLAHHGLATLVPGIILFAPAPLPAGPYEPPAPPDVRIAVATPEVVRSRGPPSV